MTKKKRIDGKRYDLAVLRAFVADGTHMDAIVDVTGWSLAKVRRLQSELFSDEERSRVGRRSEDVWVEYALRTEDHIAALDDVIEQFRGSSQGSALVGAIKAKQDLLDRVIKLGQELGFVKREPQRSIHILANMSDPELRKRLQDRLNAFRELAGQSGDTHLLDVTTDDTPGEVIQVPAAPTEPDPGAIKRTPRRDPQLVAKTTDPPKLSPLARIKRRLSRKVRQ
jgi:hypothetical protein